MIEDTTNLAVEAGTREAHAPVNGLNPRTLTVGQLAELLIVRKALRKGSQARRDFRSRAKRFCRELGRSLDEPATRLFDSRFRQHLAAVVSQVVKTSKAKDPKHAARNVQAVANELHSEYQKLLASPTLHPDFAIALNAAIASKGWSVTRLVTEMKARVPNGEWHTAVFHYANRTSHPRGKKGIAIVSKLEDILELAPGTLHTRAFAAKPLIKAGSAGPDPYRERQSELSNEEYQYQLEDIPPLIAPFWPQIVDWRSRSAITVPWKKENGRVWIKRPWASKATEKMNRYYLLRFASYLHLPRATKPFYELTMREKWKTGKGMDVDKIGLAQIFDVQNLDDYVDECRKVRQHAGELTSECIDLVQSLALLCRYPHSFVNMHPELAHHFKMEPMPMAEWHKWVFENLAEPLLYRLKGMRAARPKELSRKPEQALRHVLFDEDPMLLMQQMLIQMDRDAPPQVRPKLFALHLRDVAIFQLLLDTALRARNILELLLGVNLRHDVTTGSWWIDVPKMALKNAKSPDSYGIVRKLSPDAAHAMSAWVKKGRPVIDPAGSSNAVFLVQPKNGAQKKSRPDLGLTQTALEQILSKYLLRYFGVDCGPHFFRHLMATAILMDCPGDYAAAAAELNISIKVCIERYAHVRQEESLKRSRAWKESKRLKALELAGQLTRKEAPRVR